MSTPPAGVQRGPFARAEEGGTRRLVGWATIDQWINTIANIHAAHGKMIC